jgi:hypothetical protein
MDACREGGITDIEMVSVFLRWELAAFFDFPVPAIIGAVFVDFLCGHIGYGLDAPSSIEFTLSSFSGR